MLKWTMADIKLHLQKVSPNARVGRTPSTEGCVQQFHKSPLSRARHIDMEFLFSCKLRKKIKTKQHRLGVKMRSKVSSQEFQLLDCIGQ